MAKPKTTSNAREVALFRYSLVRPLVDPRLSAAQRGELVRELTSHQHIGPGGHPVSVSRSSIDRWVRALRLDGFEALVPRPRVVTARTAAQWLELAAALKRERPARTAAQIVRIIRERHGRAPSASTLRRLFARLGLNRHAEPAGAQQEAFGRFEANFPNELWISDGLHAGSVRGPVIEGRDTVLVAILDDHSRYVVYARWGFAEDTLALQAVLHDAVKTHGCPAGFYCDHGSAYTSGQLAWSLAILNIKIIHSRAGRPQGRGKIERWNRTVRMQFLVEVETGAGTGGTPVSSLAELNQLFHAWLHQSYHRGEHSETGQTPLARYHQRGESAAPPGRPTVDQLRRAFLWRETRKVTSWRSVSLLGNRYEVDAALVGYEVDLLFNPFELDRIDVEYHGRPMGQARPHNLTRHVHPEVKAPTKKQPAHATGIDYLRLLEAAHQAEVGVAINFPALDPTPDHAGNDNAGAAGDDEPQA